MIDSHCHLDHEPLLDNLEAVIQRSKDVGITKLLTISTSLKSFQNVKELIQKDNQEIYLVLFTKLLKKFETQTQNHAIQYTTVKQNNIYTYVKISKQKLQYVL